MSTNTVKLISPERVKTILDCYGSNPDAWPEDEKVAALSLIQHSSELRELQQEAVKLDGFLSEAVNELNLDGGDSNTILGKIVNSLPEQAGVQHPQFVNRDTGGKNSLFDWNKTLGTIAASVAVVAISLSIFNITPDSVKPVSSVAASQVELDNWMWEQVVGESVDESDEPIGMACAGCEDVGRGFLEGILIG